MITIDDVVKEYNTNKERELEIRMIINPKDAKKLIDAFSLKNQSFISKTINLIYMDKNKSRIIVKDFTDKPTLDYQSKERIMSLNVPGHISYKVAVAIERKIGEFKPAGGPSLCRLKYRYSVIVEDWRMDWTITHEEDSIEKIKTHKHIFDKQFNEALESSDDVEFEIERLKPLNVADIDQIMNQIINIIDADYVSNKGYQAAIYKIAGFLAQDPKRFRYNLGLKHLVVNVKGLDWTTLAEIRPKLNTYYISDKADGERALAIAENGHLQIISSKITTIVIQDKNPIALTIVDGEYVDNILYIFDVMYYNGEDLRNLIFSERVQLLPDVANKLSVKYKKMALIESQKTIDEFKKYITGLPYYCDGYILTPGNEIYKQHIPIYKVKFPKDITIDFLLKRYPKRYASEITDEKLKDGYDLYVLFCTINSLYYSKYKLMKIPHYDELFNNTGDVFPIQFSPSSNPLVYTFQSKEDLDSQICEMYYNCDGDCDNGKWQLHRIRHDRKVEYDRGNYFGNFITVAESTFQSYRKPISIDDLLEGDLGYFQQHDNQLYREVRSFNSFVKTKNLSKVACKVAIDFASGKGQDLDGRYGAQHFDHVLFIDNDEAALQELVNRKSTMKNSMQVSVLCCDLTDRWKVNSKKILRLLPNKADLVVCNFALHYFVSSLDQLENIVCLIKSVSNFGASFLFTTFDGAAIHKQLSAGNWNAYEKTVLKYSIKKLYKSSKPEFGQKISAILPFTDGKYYEEYVMPINLIINYMSENGFKQIEYRSFGDYLNEYAKKNNLTSDDKIFVSLYSYVIMRVNHF